MRRARHHHHRPWSSCWDAVVATRWTFGRGSAAGLLPEATFVCTRQRVALLSRLLPKCRASGIRSGVYCLGYRLPNVEDGRLTVFEGFER